MGEAGLLTALLCCWDQFFFLSNQVEHNLYQ